MADAVAGWNPRTNIELLGELLIAGLWGDLSHHHCFTKLKKKKKENCRHNGGKHHADKRTAQKSLLENVLIASCKNSAITVKEQ